MVPAAWVAGERKVDHWRTLARARAIENTAYVVAVGQPGRSLHRALPRGRPARRRARRGRPGGRRSCSAELTRAGLDAGASYQPQPGQSTVVAFLPVSNPPETQTPTHRSRRSAGGDEAVAEAGASAGSCAARSPSPRGSSSWPPALVALVTSPSTWRPRWSSTAGAVAVSIAYAWALAVRTGGRPVVFGLLALAIGVGRAALRQRGQLRSGAAVLTTSTCAVLAVHADDPRGDDRPGRARGADRLRGGGRRRGGGDRVRTRCCRWSASSTRPSRSPC